MRINIDYHAANQIASELPDISHIRFDAQDDAEYIIHHIRGGISRLKYLSPVEATSRQLWLRNRSIDDAFNWLAKHYQLFPKKGLTTKTKRDMVDTYTR